MWAVLELRTAYPPWRSTRMFLYCTTYIGRESPLARLKGLHRIICADELRLYERRQQGVPPGSIMIARRVACCTLRRQTNRVVCRTRTSRRKLSSAPSASPQSPTTNPFVGLTTELDRIAPRFDIEASQIDVLDSPSSFYETLKVSSLHNF